MKRCNVRFPLDEEWETCWRLRDHKGPHAAYGMAPDASEWDEFRIWREGGYESPFSVWQREDR